MRRRLLRWYGRHARDLPWRHTSDPYAVWVSEIMLQQTQVATAERYYPRFLAAFPTVAALAAASEEQVLRQWEGLGYYRRARQLHAAAKKIVAEHGGRFPRDVLAVRRLPGIGRYTAGAILSIAFDARLPILEANTVRLLSRLTGYRGEPTSGAGQKLLWAAAESLLAARGNGQLNQALMELGSLICTPRNPQCDRCPLEAHCPTQRAGLQASIPAPRRAAATEDVREVAVVIVRRGAVLLRKCGDGERWAGLWDFPRFAAATTSRPIAGHIARAVEKLTGISIDRPRHLATLRHGVTRFRITLDCFTATASAGALRGNRASTNGHGKQLRWVQPVELDEYPLSTTGRKLARLI